MRHELAMIVLASAWAVNAHAKPVTTLDWWPHDLVETASIQPKGLDDDFIVFSLAGARELFSSAVSNHINGANGKKGGTVYLYEEAGDNDTLLFQYDFGGTLGSTTHEFQSPAYGEYHYRVVGTGPGASGGAYTLSSSLSEEPALIAEAALAEATDLPEPQSHGLVLAGLAAIGLVSLRRKA